MSCPQIYTFCSETRISASWVPSPSLLRVQGRSTSLAYAAAPLPPADAFAHAFPSIFNIRFAFDSVLPAATMSRAFAATSPFGFSLAFGKGGKGAPTGLLRRQVKLRQRKFPSRSRPVPFWMGPFLRAPACARAKEHQQRGTSHTHDTRPSTE
jgi:hypothetical protein